MSQADVDLVKRLYARVRADGHNGPLLDWIMERVSWERIEVLTCHGNDVLEAGAYHEGGAGWVWWFTAEQLVGYLDGTALLKFTGHPASLEGALRGPADVMEYVTARLGLHHHKRSHV